ncbi:MAG: hypothetical protein QXH20_04795 [Candidatus Bathyarchaeia archaeon]
MEYFIVVSVPPDTPVEDAVSVDVAVEGEYLAEIAYLFPPGPCGLLKFALFYGENTIYPVGDNKWVCGDNLFRQVPFNWRLPEYVTVLTVKAYNEDSQYEHSVLIWLRTELAEDAKPHAIIRELTDVVKRFLGVNRR